jgi:hypothetical protein
MSEKTKKTEKTKAAECALVGAAAGWLVLNALLLAVSPSPLGLLATAAALAFLIGVICVTTGD